MKNRIISFILALTLVVSALFGTAVFAGAEATDAGYVGTSLNLAENITVKVQVTPSADAAFARITVDGQTPVTVNAADIAKLGNDYILEAEVAVKDFAKDVKFELVDADGNAFFEKVTSAKAYCDVYKEGEFAGLLASLEIYAAAAAAYFDGAAAVAVDADLSAVAGAVRSGTMPAGLTHRSATLLLESETTVRHYFALEEGKFIENFKFFVDLNKDGVADANEILTPETKTDKEDNILYYVDIDGITPNELDIAYTVGVYGVADGNTYTCSYGALTYAKSKANQNSKLATLVKALYNYNAAASELKGNVTFNANGGSTVDTDITYYEYGVATPIIAATSQAGKSFLGWFNGSTRVTEISASQKGDITLTAKWGNENQYFNSFSEFEEFSVGEDGTKTSTQLAGWASSANASAGTVKKATMKDAAGNDVKGAAFDLTSIKNTYAKTSGKKISAAYNDGFSQIKYTIQLAKLADTTNTKVMPIVWRFRNSGEGGGYIEVLKLDTSGNIFVVGNDTNCDLTTTVRTYEITLDMQHVDNGGGAYKEGFFTLMLKVDGEIKGVYRYDLKDDISEHNNGTDGLANFRFDNPGALFIANVSVDTLESPVIAYPQEATLPENAPMTYTPGTATKLPTNVTRDGYIFAGWYSDAPLTHPISEIPANAHGFYRVYAKWISVTEYNYSFANPTEINSGICSSHADTTDDGFCDSCGYCVSSCGVIDSKCDICELAQDDENSNHHLYAKTSSSNAKCQVCGAANESKCAANVDHRFIDVKCNVCEKPLSPLTSIGNGAFSTRGLANFFFTEKATKLAADGTVYDGTVYGLANRQKSDEPYGSWGNSNISWAELYAAGCDQITYNLVMAKANEEGKVAGFQVRIRDLDKKNEVKVIEVSDSGAIYLFGTNTGVALDMVAREYSFVVDISEGNTGSAVLLVDGAKAFETSYTLPADISTYTKKAGDRTGQIRIKNNGTIWFGSIEVLETKYL